MWILHLDGQRACFLGWIVVPAWKDRIPDEDHPLNCYVKNLAKFANSIAFVDAVPCDIDGGRAAQTHGKLRDQRIEDCLYLLWLGEIGVPLQLFLKRRWLPQGGVSDLASVVVNDLAPDFFDVAARCVGEPAAANG